MLLLSLHLCRKRVSESQSANLGWENHERVTVRGPGPRSSWHATFDVAAIIDGSRFLAQNSFFGSRLLLQSWDSNLDRTLIFGETTTPKTAGTPKANAPVALLWGCGTTHEA